MDDCALELYFTTATDTRSPHQHTTAKEHAEPPSYLLQRPGGRCQAPRIDGRFGGDVLGHSHQFLPLKVHHTTVAGHGLGTTADDLEGGQPAWEGKRQCGERQPLGRLGLPQTEKKPTPWAETTTAHSVRLSARVG